MTAIGCALPANVVSQAEAASLAAEFIHDERRRGLVEGLYRRTGVRQRSVVVPDGAQQAAAAPAQRFFAPAQQPDDRGPTTAERMQYYEAHAPALAELACRRALGRTDVEASQITHLVTVSCTGMAAPGVDLELVQRLDLPAGVARSHIGFMGCHGMLNSLRVARGFAQADPTARVLVSSVELCSLHLQYTSDPQQIVANALFADGAAATVVQAAQPGQTGWTLVAQGSQIVPETADLMSWRIRDHGFEMTLSPRIPDVIAAQLKPWLSQWLQSSGYRLQDIRNWAIHPGGPRILRACAEAVGFDPKLLEPSRSVLAEHGNMSSATVLFILERLRSMSAEGPCVLLAFGPGLTIEAALLV